MRHLGDAAGATGATQLRSVTACNPLAVREEFTSDITAPTFLFSALSRFRQHTKGTPTLVSCRRALGTKIGQVGSRILRAPE